MSDLSYPADTPKETKPPADSEDPLGPVGIRSMQGEAPEPSEQEKRPEITFSDPALQAQQDEWNRTHDPANWEYKLGSPHQDYLDAKNLEAANRQVEISRGAATADSLGDVVNTTLSALHESKDKGETPGDQHLHEKYGYQPYTTDAYPKDTSPKDAKPQDQS